MIVGEQVWKRIALRGYEQTQRRVYEQVSRETWVQTQLRLEYSILPLHQVNLLRDVGSQD